MRKPSSVLADLRHEIPELPERAEGGRWDVQGLRALAVVAVVVDHLTGWPGGGFVGVDVFFVISGFLITGILVREREKTGHISFISFYQRRIKRILPASVAVIATTLVAGHFILLENRQSALRIDSLWALFFSANWRFGLQETDYFNADRAISPLQHYWSLGVEEQFYFVWPWLMLLIFAALSRRNRSHRTARVAVGAVMVGITVASFGYAVWQTQANSYAAYFSTPTRAWELGVGASLSIAIPLLQRIPQVIRPALAWLGFAGIITSFWVINGASGFPAPSAALPVLSTALVIAAGTMTGTAQQRWFWPLTNRVSGYVGNLSYSLYLWHFPIIILLSAYYGPADRNYYILAVLLMAGLAVSSYYAIEEPLRNAPWLEKPWSRRTFAEYDWRPAQFSLLALGVAVCAFMIPAALANGRPPPASRYSSVTADFGSDLNSGPKESVLPPEEVSLQTGLASSLGDTVFPEFDPKLSTLTTEQWINSLVAGVGCSDVTADNVESCTFGPVDAKKTAVVIGDSYAMSWMPAVRAALEPDYRIMQLTRGECPVWNLPIKHGDDTPFPECEQQLQWALGEVEAQQPDLVIVADSDTGVTRLADGATVDDISTSMAVILRQLAKSSKRVAVLSAPPATVGLQECVTRAGTPDDCVTQISNTWDEVQSAESSAAKAAQVTYIDDSVWFCVDRTCPGWLGTTPIRADGAHMTLQYSSGLGPALRNRLL